MKKTKVKDICKMLFFVVAVISMLSWASEGFCQSRKVSVITDDVVTVQPITGNGSAQDAHQGVVLDSNAYGDCCECDDGFGSCSSGGPCGMRNSLHRNMAATACYNCKVNGSYKYPVPRQYTYFWPGIYSQKRMTDYVSPHQGLRLESPAKVFK